MYQHQTPFVRATTRQPVSSVGVLVLQKSFGFLGLQQKPADDELGFYRDNNNNT